MNILVIGDQDNLSEINEKFRADHTIHHSEELNALDSEMFFSCKVVFDFVSADIPESLSFYDQHPTLTVFLNTVKISLKETFQFTTDPLKTTFFGFNGLKSFVNTNILECSMLDDSNSSKLHSICEELGTDYELVEDRVGLVTPRIVCMIINEAYFTVQEGTADKEAINTAMKLGTNYPHGPFEWTHKIGLIDVYETLESIYEDTKDERYKIAPLLKSEYLKKMMY